MTEKERVRWALTNSLATLMGDRAELDRQIESHVQALAKLEDFRIPESTDRA